MHTIEHNIDNTFTPTFQQFLITKNPTPVLSLSYYLTLLNNVANYINTEMNPQAKYHTSSPFQIFQEFPSTCESMVSATLLEILLLPFSATEIATKLLDIVQPVKETAAILNYNADSYTYVDNAFMNVEGTGMTPSDSQMMELDVGKLLSNTDPFLDIQDDDESLGGLDFMDDTRQGKEKEKEREKGGSPSSRPTNRTISTSALLNFMGGEDETDSGNNANVGGPPSFAQVVAVSLVLGSLPKQFHNPVYERAVQLLKQSPLLPHCDLVSEAMVSLLLTLLRTFTIYD